MKQDEQCDCVIGFWVSDDSDGYPCLNPVEISMYVRHSNVSAPDKCCNFCYKCGKSTKEHLASIDLLIEERKINEAIKKRERFEREQKQLEINLAEYDQWMERQIVISDSLEPPNSSMPIPPEAIAAYRHQP